MFRGKITKMDVQYNNPVKYNLIIGEDSICLNDLLHQHITFRWSGKVICHCGKLLPKFYRQNFCYQCYWNHPAASQSIFKPELCTADLGIEERDLEWEKKFQIAPHYVYLANSSGLKVGITRKNQKITRWIDQGARQAILFAEVPNRRLSGLIELELKQLISDKTNWRKMLSASPPLLNLVAEKEKYVEYISSEFQQFIVSDNEVLEIEYPVLNYPNKVNSVSLPKSSVIEGKLSGVKGQYLIFDNNNVFNVRSHDGYIVDVSF